MTRQSGANEPWVTRRRRDTRWWRGWREAGSGGQREESGSIGLVGWRFIYNAERPEEGVYVWVGFKEQLQLVCSKVSGKLFTHCISEHARLRLCVFRYVSCLNNWLLTSRGVSPLNTFCVHMLLPSHVVCNADLCILCIQSSTFFFFALSFHTFFCGFAYLYSLSSYLSVFLSHLIQMMMTDAATAHVAEINCPSEKWHFTTYNLYLLWSKQKWFEKHFSLNITDQAEPSRTRHRVHGRPSTSTGWSQDIWM